jgi:hypothetical protein
VSSRNSDYRQLEYKKIDAERAYKDLHLTGTDGRTWAEIAVHGNIKLSQHNRETVYGKYESMEKDSSELSKTRDAVLKEYMEARDEMLKSPEFLKTSRVPSKVKELFNQYTELDDRLTKVRMNIGTAIVEVNRLAGGRFGEYSLGKTLLDYQASDYGMTGNEEDAITREQDLFNKMTCFNPLMSSKPVKLVYAPLIRGHQADDHIQTNKFEGTTLHELGHELEARDDIIGVSAFNFWQRRTETDETHRLSEVTKNNNYRDNEYTRLDKFIDPYMGKIYPGRGTEITSMGLQLMMTDPFKLMTNDPEYYDFVWAITHLG